MKRSGLSAFVIVSSDAHSSEYVADRWKAREWISGFDGSAGTAVVTLDKALLWTDSRYWLAADKVLADNGYELMKDGAADTPSIVEWLCANMDEGAVVGVDATVCSIAEFNAWSAALSSCGLSLESVNDPFDELWSDRPALPMGDVEIMPMEIAGESAADKIARLRKELVREGVEGMLMTMLDEVAWITNMRGCDVEYNPVFVSYMLITADSAVLYIAREKLNEELSAYLQSQGIDAADYNDVWKALENYNGNTLLVQPNKCNAAIVNFVGSGKLVYKESPVARMKAVKNSVEIAGFKRAMIAEGIAMVKLLYWLKGAVQQGDVSELDVDRKLTVLRNECELFRGLSFSTIAAYGENAAIVHYEPTEKEYAMLGRKGMLLLDCGGQYSCGTTDVTRTIALGELTQEEKEDYTRVLRGHISLAMAKFPKGTCGTQLDVLARQWLWRAAENYLHGTGHGVGHFLNVHEGPHQIRMNNVPTPLQPGMIVTNEPGLYKAGRYGIRIENTMLVTEYMNGEFGEFYALEPLTVVPIDKSAIVPGMMDEEALDYLNDYNAWVFESLHSYFSGEELEFMKGLCSPI